jgi:preprotein translocase subunit SecG
MDTLQTILLVVQVLVAISLIGLILIQHGKGADAGAAFGSGASNTIFGAQGSGNFLTRTTSILAFVFLVNSMVLAYMANQRVAVSTSLMDQPLPAVTQPAQPQEVTPASDIPAEPPVESQSEVPAIPE